MSAVSPRRAQTVERLVEAAMAVFAERGVQGASVEEICERAGFTRGAFYSNFDSIDELCLEVVRSEGGRLSGAAKRAIEAGADDLASDDPVAQAIAIFTAQGSGPLGSGPLVSAELRLHAARRPHLRSPYLALYRQGCADSAEMLVAGLARVGMELTIDPTVAVELLGAVYEQSSMLAVIGEDEETAGGPLTQLIRALVRPIPA